MKELLGLGRKLSPLPLIKGLACALVVLVKLKFPGMII
jgi:hypothetical protein